MFTTVYEEDSFVPIARIVERQPHLLEKAKLDEQAEWDKYQNAVLSNNTKANIHHKVHTGLRIYHYHTDHLGTPQELTNDRGDVVWLNYSLAWGGSFDKLNNVHNLDGLDVSADLLQPIRFQGQFFDGETNLHYNRFRYYDSDVGMFISRDPIELLGGINTFQYVPNPTVWFDPFGLAKNFNQIKGDYGEEWAMKALRDKSKYLSIFSVKNNSNHGLDIVAKRPDGKYDIFEVKSSEFCNFGLTKRQANGKDFAKTVLLGDVPNKGGYYKQGLNGLKINISNAEARRIYQNLGDTKKIYVNICRNRKGEIALESMVISPW